MPYQCVVCKKTVRKNQHAVSCDGCGDWTHRVCDTGISITRYREVTASDEDFPFTCVNCTPVPDAGDISDVIGAANITFAVTLQESIEMPDDRVPDLSDVNISSASFSEVDDPQERSIIEASFQEPPGIPDRPRSYSIVEQGSQKGKKKLVDTYGFAYVVRRSTTSAVYWRCSVRNKTSTCSATVTHRGSVFTEGPHEHNHPAEAGIHTIVSARVQIKDQAKQQVFKSGSTIVEEVQQKLVDPNQPGGRQNMSTLIRMANRTREKLRPKEPRNLSFEFVEGFLPADFVRADIRVHGQRHIVLATDKQLRHLSRVRQWFLDGTFKVVKDPFYQLLSIHAFVKADQSMKMMPMAFVLMSRRKTRDYVAVLRKIMELLPMDPQVSVVVMDFEPATWKAFAKILPHIKIRGCLFHLTQAIWRKTQDVGLKVAYMSDEKTHKFVRKLMALPFLPHGDITRVFYRIADRVPGQGKINELAEYVRRQWIEHRIFKPKAWSVFGVTVRTNNHVEGWHRRFNLKCGEQALGIYRLIPQLYSEAEMLPLNMRLIEEGRLRAYVRQKSAKRQKDIFDAWSQFKNGEVSLFQLLARCSSLHGPVTN